MELLNVGEDPDHKLHVFRFNDISLMLGSSIDYKQVLNYLPNGCEIYSDQEKQAEMEKLKQSDKISEATPNITPSHKSHGQRSVDKKRKDLTNFLAVMDPMANLKNFSSNLPINLSGLKTPVKGAIEENKGLGKGEGVYKVVNEKKYLLNEIKYDLEIYQKVDLANVDYLLVSKLDNVLALPFITEKLGFQGEIVMTLPMRQIAIQILIEFIRMNGIRKEKGNMVKGVGTFEMDNDYETNFMNSYPSFIFEDNNQMENSEALEELEKSGIFLSEWYQCYTEEDLESLTSKIITVNYGQHLDLRGGLRVIARSSGYHIGACTFSLQYGVENLLVIDSFSKHRYRHPLSLDLTDFRDYNRVYITESCNSEIGLKSKGEKEKGLATSEISINRYISNLKKIMKERPENNIVFPVRNSIFLLDLIEIFQYKLPSLRKIHIISSTFLSTINYSNANVDYLNQNLQNKIFSKKPILPVNIEKLILSNKVEFFDDLYIFVQKVKNHKNYISDLAPSFYIVVDPTLRLGYSAKIVEILNSEFSNGTLIFSDPHLTLPEIMSPLHSVNKLKCSYQPLNMSDSVEELIEILENNCPEARIIAPSSYKNQFSRYRISYRTDFVERNDSILYKMDSKTGLYIKPQTFNSLRWMPLESLLGKKLRSEKYKVAVMEAGVNNDKGKLRLEVKSRKKKEKAAVMVVKEKEVINEKSILEKMYTLAQKLKEKQFQVLNVERRMDEESVYVLKLMGCKSFGINIIKHSPMQTEIYTDDDQEYDMILNCVRNVLGVYCI